MGPEEKINDNFYPPPAMNRAPSFVLEGNESHFFFFFE